MKFRFARCARTDAIKNYRGGANGPDMSQTLENDLWIPDGDVASDRRNHRWDVNFKTMLEIAGERVDCAVYDLSPSGACIGELAPSAIPAGERIIFEIPGYGWVPAEVRYDSSGYQGLMFLHEEGGEEAVANYLPRVEQKHRAAALNVGDSDPDTAASESIVSETTEELAAQSLDNLEARAQEAAHSSADEFKTVAQELRNRCGRLEEEVRSLRLDRDRLVSLLEALVERIEANTSGWPVENDSDGEMAETEPASAGVDDETPDAVDLEAAMEAEPTPAVSGTATAGETAETPEVAEEAQADTTSPDATAEPDEAADDAPVDLTLRRKYLSGLKRLRRLRATSSDTRQRDTREEPVAGTVKIGEQRYPLKNWSARGFCVGPCMMTPNPGDRMDIAFSVPLPEPVLEFACRTAVMRLDKARQEFAGVFFNLDEKTRGVIDQHFQISSPKRQPKDLLQNLKSALRRD